MRQKSRKGAEMAYKKPEVVAKSEAKQSFVAGCPAKEDRGGGCSKDTTAYKCMINKLK